MFPINTRQVIRSVSPPPRRRIPDPKPEPKPESKHEPKPATTAPSDNAVTSLSAEGTNKNGGSSDAASDSGAIESSADKEPAAQTVEPPGGSVSIRSAVREYERAFDELAMLNKRSKDLRAHMTRMRGDVEVFMRERNLEKIGTRDGRLVVRVTTSNKPVRLGKRETTKCVEQTVGESHPDLAQELIRKLFEENRAVRTVTRFDKKPAGEKTATV